MRRRARPYLVATVAALLGLGLSARPGHGQGWIEPHPRHPRHIEVERVHSDVSITVDGTRRVARIEVEEVFRNRSGVVLEGDYLYPIPAGAVFTEFSLFMGEREMRGEVMPADRARKIYEEIVRRRKDPALIELMGQGVLRARVFPVEPGATRRVILRYTQILGRDGDLLHLRYPRLVGVLPGVQPVERGRHDRPGSHPFTLRVRVSDAERFATPYSPTHRIEVRERDGALEVLHSGDGAVRDFDLFLPLRESRVGASVVTHAPAGESGYFMLLITPPALQRDVEIARDVSLVLDVSGSMSGHKIEQARAALERLLAGLRPTDRFRLITFSSVVRSFRPDFVAATPANLRAARDFLAGVRATGSTNIVDALRTALEPRAADERLAQIVFLTDGKPTVGETAPERIAEMAERLRDAERVFAFGVGYDVNTYLLDRMVERGHGAVTYVGPGEDVEAAVSSLAGKISSPVLADLRIVDAPATLEDRHPDPLPDLFQGQDLVIFGRYRGAGAGDLVLEGRRAGRTERFSYRVEFPEREPDNDFIPRLWAARKAGALTAQLRLHGADPELVEEIRQLGLRYGILTEYTSYLVEEPRLVRGERPEERVLERARELAAAPEMQSGADAFDRAEKSSRMQGASRLDDAERIVRTATVPANGEAVRQVRQVGRRLFVLRDGVWNDVRVAARDRIVKVAPYSDAYFELVRRLPHLAPYVALGERVRIAGDGLTIELAADGQRSWRAAELETVLSAFANVS